MPVGLVGIDPIASLETSAEDTESRQDIEEQICVVGQERRRQEHKSGDTWQSMVNPLNSEQTWGERDRRKDLLDGTLIAS